MPPPGKPLDVLHPAGSSYYDYDYNYNSDHDHRNNNHYLNLLPRQDPTGTLPSPDFPGSDISSASDPSTDVGPAPPSTGAKEIFVLCAITISVIACALLASYLLYKAVQRYRVCCEERAVVMSEVARNSGMSGGVNEIAKWENTSQGGDSACTVAGLSSTHVGSSQAHSASSTSSNCSTRPTKTSVDLFSQHLSTSKSTPLVSSSSSAAASASSATATGNNTSTNSVSSESTSTMVTWSGACMLAVGDAVVGAHPAAKSAHQFPLHFADNAMEDEQPPQSHPGDSSMPNQGADLRGFTVDFPWITDDMKFGLIVPSMPVGFVARPDTYGAYAYEPPRRSADADESLEENTTLVMIKNRLRRSRKPVARKRVNGDVDGEKENRRPVSQLPQLVGVSPEMRNDEGLS